MANLISETKSNGATHEFKNKIHGVENAIEQISHSVGEKIGAMASDIATSASEIKDSASEYVKTGREYVKKNPAKGVAMAAAAGVAIGSLLTLAMQRRQLS